MAVALPETGMRSFMFERSSSHLHRGIDLPAPVGTAVYSVAPGVVVDSGVALSRGYSGYGAFVVVQAADGTYHLYAHLDDVRAVRGSYVTGTTRIGSVGRTCFNRDDPDRLCQGSHLHFEVSATPYPQDSEAPRLDPVAYLSSLGSHPFERNRFGYTVPLLSLAVVVAAAWSSGVRPSRI